MNRLDYNYFIKAHCFYGKELLDQEKCGESIRILQHSEFCMYCIKWFLLPLCLFLSQYQIVLLNYVLNMRRLKELVQ